MLTKMINVIVDIESMNFFFLSKVRIYVVFRIIYCFFCLYIIMKVVNQENQRIFRMVEFDLNPNIMIHDIIIS